MKRVLHLIESGGLYGAESVILNLSVEMLKDGPYKPVVGCIVQDDRERSDLYDEAMARGIPAVKLRLRNALLPWDLPRAVRRIRAQNIDLIHSHGYKPSVYGYFAKLLAGCEIMSTCHLWFKGGHAPLKMRVMIALELYLYRRYRMVVGVSREIFDTLRHAGVPEDRIRIIRNGVEIDGIQRSARRVRDGVISVLNSGRLTKQKAQHSIIQAAVRLKAEGLAVRFRIVGEGELRAELEDQIQAGQVSDYVELLGFRDDVPELLADSDIYILPSYDEGMPMGLLEAVVSGVPVIASAVGDVPDVIRHEETGLVIPPGDADALAAGITRLAGDPALGERLSAAAARIVRDEYSSRTMSLAYRAIYGELIGA